MKIIQKRKRQGRSSQTCGTPYLVPSPCASVPRTYCSKRRGHMAWAIAMASWLQSVEDGRLGGQLEFESYN